ncbi:hypothetical protein CEXT_462501 [Caerostris extrusa]|uniref:Uncharacterized protein n=1 Tax=Caerostris extrusa TaxID=172846 RepID=A0AAV4WNY6_CAEEX|nr:hypothetical protein CEXT_462501 [Caerostris extrusa]
MEAKATSNLRKRQCPPVVFPAITQSLCVKPHSQSSNSLYSSICQPSISAVIDKWIRHHFNTRPPHSSQRCERTFRLLPQRNRRKKKC